MFLLAVGIMFLTACAQKKGGERGPRQGGGMSINKDSDSTFVALKNETLKKFKQLTFEDVKTGKTMAYNLLVPEGYDGMASYPLVLFMADALRSLRDMERWSLPQTVTNSCIRRSCWFPNTRNGPSRMTGVRLTKWK